MSMSTRKNKKCDSQTLRRSMRRSATLSGAASPMRRGCPTELIPVPRRCTCGRPDVPARKSTRSSYGAERPGSRLFDRPPRPARLGDSRPSPGQRQAIAARPWSPITRPRPHARCFQWTGQGLARARQRLPKTKLTTGPRRSTRPQPRNPCRDVRPTHPSPQPSLPVCAGPCFPWLRRPTTTRPPIAGAKNPPPRNRGHPICGPARARVVPANVAPPGRMRRGRPRPRKRARPRPGRRPAVETGPGQLPACRRTLPSRARRRVCCYPTRRPILPRGFFPTCTISASSTRPIWSARAGVR